jgi:hypothetical protein
MVGISEGITVNGFKAELAPWVATTFLDPLNDEGTVNEAENPPLLLGVIGLVTVVPPNVMVTAVVGAKPVPVTATGVPTGPDVELSIMVGVNVDVTVNVFEGELVPSVPITVWSPVEEDEGTLKVAVKNPAAVLVTVLGVVAIAFPSNLIVIVELPSKPAPVTITEVPAGPEDGLSAMTGVSKDVTVNVFEAELLPWVALTVWSPVEDDKDTKKVALNPPLEVDVTVASEEPSKVIATVEIGSNPLPVTVTEVPTGPEDGLSVMAELLVPEALKFHSQLSSTPFDPKQSKKLPFWSWMLDDIDAM